MVENPSIVASLALWEEKAPFCSCNSKQKVIYFCSEKTCPNHQQQSFCYECLKKGKHNHFPLVELTEIIAGLDSNWSKLSERFSTILGHAQKNFLMYEPVIKYFEREMLQCYNIPAALMINCKQIGQDYDKLMDLTK